MSGEVAAVYVDGGVVGVNPSPIGGTYAWCWVDAEDNLIDSGSGFIPAAACGGTVSNNESEMAALIAGLRGLPKGWSGRVCSDSQITLGRAFSGWRYKPHGTSKGIPEAWMLFLRMILKRLGEVTPFRLDGHPTLKQLAAQETAGPWATGIGKRGGTVSRWNVLVDRLCAEQALMKAKELEGGVA